LAVPYLNYDKRILAMCVGPEVVSYPMNTASTRVPELAPLQIQLKRKIRTLVAPNWGLYDVRIWRKF